MASVERSRNPALAERLARLAPDQRAAATAPPGPVLCVAPAGSGKTTTLVARVAWLVDSGVDPATIAAITFNRRAAEELSDRLRDALEPLLGAAAHGTGESGETGPAGSPAMGGGALGASVRLAVRVRTFHALGLEILREAGEAVAPLLDRETVLAVALPGSSPLERRRLDTVISRLKLDIGVDPDAVAGDPEAGPAARAFVAYERALGAASGLDFDDLVVRAVRLLEREPDVLATWRGRCAHLLVDEAQDLDRSQLRMALLLAAPANRIFLVGDDDQSIYGWRLADVRRLLTLAETALPGLRRVDLVTNYRCPASVVARAVRLVERNEERFAKRIEARPSAPGPVILAASSGDDTDRSLSVLRAWRNGLAQPDAGSDATPTTAILARTNRELLPAVVAAVAEDVPFRGAGLELPVDSPGLAGLLDRIRGGGTDRPLLVAIGALRSTIASDEQDTWRALLAWAPAFADIGGLAAAIDRFRERLAQLRRDDAPLTLATAHGTKGLEFDHVAVIGMDEGRFPSARSVAESDEPARALEEERRLAYVAWTRARRSLVLVYDPDAPSAFLREAFDPVELAPAAWHRGAPQRPRR